MDRKTMCFRLNGAASNTLHMDVDSTTHNLVAVGGRSIFKIFRIDDDNAFFTEVVNMRFKGANLNYSCNDVAWSPFDASLLVTASTNSAIILWDLAKATKHRMVRIFNDHQRVVNKVSFHLGDPMLLASGSQDGTMRLFDLRLPEENVKMVVSKDTSVRDVQWNPHNHNQLAAACENGLLQLWDVRKPDIPENHLSAHTDHIFTCDWHPEVRNVIASAGRDKHIKVWDVGPRKPVMKHMIRCLDAVAKVHWRPKRPFQIASISQLSDYSVQVWDVRRPFVPFASFTDHTEVPTSFLWRQSDDPHNLLSVAKDNLLYQHNFKDAKRIYETGNPVALDFNINGRLIYSFRSGNSQHVGDPYSNLLTMPAVQPAGNVTTFKTSSIMTKQERFRANASLLVEIQSSNNNGFPSDLSHLRILAQNYKCSGLPFTQLCDHNAGVSLSVGSGVLAQSWDLLKSLYLTDAELLEILGNPETTVEEPRTPTKQDDQVTKAEVDGEDHPSYQKPATDKPAPNGLDGLRSRAGTTTITTNFRERGTSSDSTKTKSDAIAPLPPSGGEDPPGTDGNADENDDTLTDIASGHLLSDYGGDFFGDLENAYWGRFVSNTDERIPCKPEPDFSALPTEAFDIQDSDFSAQESSQKGGEQAHEDASRMVASSSDEVAVPQTCITMVNNAMNMLEIDMDLLDSDDAFNPDEVFVENLNYIVDSNDPQTAIAMYLVASARMNNKKLIDGLVLEHWYSSCISLLLRMGLYHEANQMMNACHLETIHCRTHRGTYIKFGCGKCGKLVEDRGLRCCKKCKAIPNRCDVCHESVNGLYAWCQGCGHGGHVDHLGDWLSENQTCPAGCGHLCEYY